MNLFRKLKNWSGLSVIYVEICCAKCKTNFPLNKEAKVNDFKGRWPKQEETNFAYVCFPGEDATNHHLVNWIEGYNLVTTEVICGMCATSIPLPEWQERDDDLLHEVLHTPPFTFHCPEHYLVWPPQKPKGVRYEYRSPHR